MKTLSKQRRYQQPRLKTVLLAIGLSSLQAPLALAEEPTRIRLQQSAISSGQLTLTDIRRAGLNVFSFPFTKADGFGDGPVDLSNPLRMGGRPTLQGNGTFLRLNGLDGQNCLECHSIVSRATVPAIFGVGGAGGINNSAIFMPSLIDMLEPDGASNFDGRLINPPALFGTGGVQLLAKEMTAELQNLKQRAISRPGRRVQLRSKGVRFGWIQANANGELDTSGVSGVDDDLVIRPFGRKGEFSSVRAFDQGAVMFHFGMQPVELVGDGVDEDGDGVVNEIGIGELSSLEVFITTQKPPAAPARNRATRVGFARFLQAGCAGCHKPALNTQATVLNYSFPEVETDPSANIFYSVDLSKGNAAFPKNRRGGLQIPLFSDLKRHDMGEQLAENFHELDATQNREFITAKLWGVGDTAPYLHDGRALTLEEAILMHGGEAARARQRFERMSAGQQQQLIGFLKSLKNPRDANADVLP